MSHSLLQLEFVLVNNFNNLANSLSHLVYLTIYSLLSASNFCILHRLDCKSTMASHCSQLFLLSSQVKKSSQVAFNKIYVKNCSVYRNTVCHVLVVI